MMCCRKPVNSSSTSDSYCSMIFGFLTPSILANNPILAGQKHHCQHFFNVFLTFTGSMIPKTLKIDTIARLQDRETATSAQSTDPTILRRTQELTGLIVLKSIQSIPPGKHFAQSRFKPFKRIDQG